VLVSTTDVRRSNSAAMYLALTSYAVNGDVVTDRPTAQAVALKVAELFKRQGYQENDGENNVGRDLAAFKAAYAQLPEDVRAIPVFMVLFGEASEADLKALVAVTGGRVFDARKASLYSVFKDIRAYQ